MQKWNSSFHFQDSLIPSQVVSCSIALLLESVSTDPWSDLTSPLNAQINTDALLFLLRFWSCITNIKQPSHLQAESITVTESTRSFQSSSEDFAVHMQVKSHTVMSGHRNEDKSPPWYWSLEITAHLYLFLSKLGLHTESKLPCPGIH